MTDPNQIESEIAELAIVEKSHVNNDGSVYVGFEPETIPESFNTEMLSKGYAISKTHSTAGIGSGATYRNITDF